jgi:Kef-type K+ transport system membrane component KefB
MNSLEIALIFLAAAVCTVVAFRLMHLPAVLGYLTAGIVISPFASPNKPHLCRIWQNLEWCF